MPPYSFSPNTVLLSGGLDSATALALLHADGIQADALFIDYGQPARMEEYRSAGSLADHFDVNLHKVIVSGISIGAGEVVGRNLLLLSTAVTARAGRSGTIVLGIHDGTSYFDCGAGFMSQAQQLVNGYHRGAVQLAAPFLKMNKGDIARLAVSQAVPLDLTYSCERRDGPCGACLSCGDKQGLDAFAA